MVGLEFGLIIRMLISLSLFEWVTRADTLDTGKSECPCIDSAMWKILGINGTNDQIKVFFNTVDEAIYFARKNKIKYQIFEPKEKVNVIKSYASNFKPKN